MPQVIVGRKHELLRAKSDERIDSSRAARRDVAREKGHQSENPGDHDVSGRVAGPDFVKQRR